MISIHGILASDRTTNMQFSRMQIKLRVIGYDTVPIHVYQPSLPKVHKQKKLALIFFAATFSWPLHMF